jgi:LacI family transcriptional regulator
MEKATIYKIAREAGVSVTTVSRFFNNPGIVKETTRDKIFAVCQKYNYQPSYIASAITTKKTKTIALIVPSFKDPMFVELIGGAEYILTLKGYSLSVFNARQSIEKELEIAKIIGSRSIDGVILSGIYGDERDKVFISEMVERNIPCIMVDRVVPGVDIPFVASNEYLGGKLAAQYLLKNNHKRIGIITYPREVYIFNERVRGFTEILDKQGLKELFLHEVALEFKNIEKKVRAFIPEMLRKKPTAIFTIADSIAFFTLRILRDNNIKVPDDISIMGYDNILYANAINPSLSTIHHDMFKLGKVVAKNLIYRLENGNYSNSEQVINPRLIVRESVMRI